MGTSAKAPPGTVILHLAGPFATRLPDSDDQIPAVGSRKARTLLKLLAVHRARQVPVDLIVDVLWGAEPPSRPEANVASLVSRLRARFGREVVTGRRDSYRLGRPPAVLVALDVAAAALAAAVRPLAAGEPALAGAVSGRVLEALGEGEALPEDRDAEWARPARTETAELLQKARHLAVKAALAVADPATARDVSAKAIAADPWDEEACRLLMRAEAALFEPARALAAYERLRASLADEFGADPAPETRRVHLSILREERAEPTAANPAPESQLAGRTAETRRLAEAWRGAAGGKPALVLISGEAGIGKTRLAAEVTDLA